jgi:thiol-disulfide isomerase/thioredoxin
MRHPYHLVMLFWVILFGVTGCGRKSPETVKISIHLPKLAGDTVVVGRTNMINLAGIELGKVRLDRAGKGMIEVTVKTTLFAYINGKDMGAGLLIAPGDKLLVETAQPDAKFPLRFTGDGAAVNQVYNEINGLGSNFDKWKGTYYFQLDKEAFLTLKDSLQNGYNQLLTQLKDVPDVSAEKLDLLQRYAQVHLLFYQFNYANGKDSADIPKSVREVVRTFPVDTISLNAGMFYYGFIGSIFYQNRISEIIYEENDDVDDAWEVIFPKLAEKKIKASHYPKPVEDFLRVKSAHDQIGSSGLSPSLLRLVSALEKEVPVADYQQVLREDVARWEKIGPGKPAPAFSGLTPDGKQLALSDLRGKVVYVDIWATWCGPCIEAFQDSRKVQAEFKGDDRIAFLYVSVDRDTLAWKKMVATRKVPAGIHILAESDSPESIWQRYNLRGIPRYVLIDERGRMVAAHAAHPASGDTQEELRKTLAAGSFAKR